MTKIAVVILNYNGQKFLDQFLPTVLAHSSEVEIIVIDNASDDESLAFLKEHFPSIRIIELSENEGYAGGYNRALTQIDSDIYVLLNSDIEVTSGWLQPIIKLMDEDNQIAACQPKILSFKDKEKFEYAGASGGFIDWLGYPFCRGRIFDTTEKDNGQYDDSRQVFWASGACFFVRSSVFHELGGFDKHFFAHMEEIDLCWRMNSAGYKVYSCPESVVYHVGAGTLPVTNPRKTYLNFNNNLLMLRKNLPFKALWYRLPIRILLDWVAAMKFLVEGQPRHSWAVLKAHYNFLFKAQTEANKLKALSSRIYKKSIVYQYFLSGNKHFNQL
ncbi:MAG: glycosyltransferase family 2 protein [Cyclobacteriaceae bacterium]